MPRCLLAAVAFATIPGFAAAADGPSYLNEVMPLLTKAGCNQGACHGKGTGQNGFKLSLRGYAPDADHASITREFDGRRLDPADPASSLLLRKSTGEASHEGGRLFGPGSREYTLLLDWVRGGAAGPAADSPKLSKLELAPNDQTVSAGTVVKLAAWATFTDGTRRDVTWLTKFDSNDAGTVEVTPHGVATARRTGATAVRAMFLTDVAVATFTVPAETPVDAARFTGRNNFVDDHVFAKLRALRIEPSDGCTDSEFVRRLFLDACGCLPKPEVVTAFAADAAKDKRAKLIDAALASPEFTDYWALQLGDLLQNRKERDHDVRGVKGVRQFHDWIRKQVAANRPWDELARDVLTAGGKTTDNPAVGYYVVTVGENRHGENSEVAESVAQAFLGTRIGCAKCHNHPLERFTQDDFYHFAAFFSRVKLDRKEAKSGPTTLTVSHPDANQNGRPVGVNQPRTNQFLKPQTLDRAAANLAPGADPRTKMAAWVTDPANPAFRGAMVNRVWQHYMGVGMVEPVDDLRATNPPSLPGLWDALGAEFARSKFDLRQLMRMVLNSRAYQLSSSSRPGNAADARFYSHYAARRLPAEVLLDAICDATGSSELFEGYPRGVRAVQVPDPGTQSYFLRLFGRSERTTACACERTGDVTLPQLLHLQNGQSVTGKIFSGQSWLPKALDAEKDDAKLLDQITLRTLSRPATAAERKVVAELIAAGDPRGIVFSDLMWAILNAKDFAFNH